MKIVARNFFFYLLAFFLVLVLYHTFFYLLGLDSEFKLGTHDLPLLYGAAGLSVSLAFLVNVKSKQRK